MKSQQHRDKETAVKRKRPKRRIRILLIVIIAIFLCLLLWNYICHKSVDEQLTTIMASLAIPDSENAAFYYRQFFSDPNNVSILEDISKHTPSSTRSPWRDSEDPVLATKLQNHKEVIQTIISISDKQKSLFKIYPDYFSDWNLMSTILRKTSFVLSWAAANDLAEGRTKDAITKYHCQMRIACHLQQTPRGDYLLVGHAFEAVAIKNIRTIAMREDLTMEHLNSLETILSIAKNNPEPDHKIVKKLYKLFTTKQRSTLPPIARFRAWFHSFISNFRNYRRMMEDEKKIKKRLLFDCNATEILIALRRFKNNTGKWPKSLDELKPFATADIFIDPTNNGSFVYKLNDDDFIMYSIGPNNIDEGGQSLHAPDDIAIWPLKIPQTNKKSAVKE